MNAPNKIYLHKIRDEESSGFYKMWFEQRARCVPSEEYIRKDALLEKLEKVAAEYKKRSDEGELVWQNMCGINDAINILNSM